MLGDLTIGHDGSVYVTDSAAGGVYVLRPHSDSLTTLLPSGHLVSPQTPVLVTGERRLLIPDYARGLASLDLASGALTWLSQPPDLAAAGIDGLYADEGGLIAIQNGTSPHRVLRLDLDPSAGALTGWHVLEQAGADLGEPNHGAIVGRTLVFIGNSGWDRVGDDGGMSGDAGTLAPALLRLDLGD